MWLREPEQSPSSDHLPRCPVVTPPRSEGVLGRGGVLGNHLFARYRHPVPVGVRKEYELPVARLGLVDLTGGAGASAPGSGTGLDEETGLAAPTPGPRQNAQVALPPFRCQCLPWTQMRLVQ